MKNAIAISDLLPFLVAAKRATYAAQGDSASVTPLLPDTRQLEYVEGDLAYRDIYWGMRRFTGVETVSHQGRAVWAMSYSGGVEPALPGEALSRVYAFLRQALRELPPDLPLRGPTELEQGALRYTSTVHGDVAAFQGVEQIAEGSNVIYELHFSGGFLV